MSEEEAVKISKRIVHDMIEEGVYYKRVKRACNSGRAVNYMTEELTYEPVNAEYHQCLACGSRGDRQKACSICLEQYEKDFYKADKIPKKLKPMVQAIKKLQGEHPEIRDDCSPQAFSFNDWRYLRLVATDLERGAVTREEAMHEAERYIDVVYEDNKDLPKRILAEYQAPPIPKEVSVSQSFMDDVLS